MAGKPTVVIRPLRGDDHASWQDLFTRYLAFYETTVPAEVMQTTFDRLLGPDPQDFSSLVAEADGRMVGLVHFLFHRHCWKVENVCYLQDLFVAEEVRGSGLGRRLIEAVYDAADAAGAPTVYWLTQEFNTRARMLYDRVGRLTPFIKYQRP